MEIRERDFYRIAIGTTIVFLIVATIILTKIFDKDKDFEDLNRAEIVNISNTTPIEISNIRTGSIADPNNIQSISDRLKFELVETQKSDSSKDNSPAGKNLNTRQDERIYKVTFRGTWNKYTHDDFFPLAGAHFSSFVGISHANKDELFKENTIATPGLEIVAETGATGKIINELINKQENTLILDYKIGEVFFTPGETSMFLVFSETHNKFSLVTMIAPSPDWFAAASNVQLFDGVNWLNTIEIDLSLFDAGTDDGKSFIGLNKNTDPKETIKEIKPEILPVGSILIQLIENEA